MSLSRILREMRGKVVVLLLLLTVGICLMRYRQVERCQCDHRPAPASLTRADEALLYEHHHDNQSSPALAAHIRRRFLLAPPLAPLSPRLYTKPDQSQVGQARAVDKLLRGRRGGFFVEAGALDGLFLSNTLFLEVSRGWSGLLVEANPRDHARLVRHGRQAYSLNACLSPNASSWIGEFAGDGIWGHDALAGSSTAARTYTVHCFPLYALMLSVGRTHIDYLSLDVEGAELAILKTIPFDKLVIDVISVEYRVKEGSSAGRLEEYRRFFRETGLYEEVAILTFNGQHTRRDALDIIFVNVVENGVDVLFKRKHL